MVMRTDELVDAELPALFEHLDVGVIVQGMRAEILYANRMALELLGLRRDQVLGVTSFDPSWDVVRPDGTPFPPAERPVARVLATGEPVLDVVLGVRRGGPERSWILANARPHRSSEGDVDYVVITLSDISSERRRMSLIEQVKDELEHAVRRRTSELATAVDELQREIGQREDATLALARSRAAFQRVTEIVPGVLYQALRRPDGAVELRFVSAHLRTLLGVAPEAAMAEPRVLLERLDDEGRRVVSRSLREADRAQSTWECDVRLRGAEGEWRWVRNHAVAERSEQGTLWTGVAIDVTEERTRAEQIRVSQTREAIGSVTAGIAHNFNNALAVIVPSLEDALEVVDAPLQRQLQHSLQTALSAASLVEQLMLIVRGAPSDHQEPVEVMALVRDVTVLCRRIFQGKLAVEEQVPDTGAWVMGQAATLRQVLLNICVNARDALHDREDGKVAISVDVDGRSTADPRVRIEIRDNGPGMDPAALQRLGEPFFTTKAPGQGTGLGLATAYATIRTLRGELTCQSTLGRGTTFTIVLPVHGLRERREDPRPAAVSRAPVPRGRILLIDDEALVRSTMRLILTKRGFQVDEAENGMVGLQKVTTSPEPFQAVLLDLSMPGISGERVLKLLRMSHPLLPVVILSGYVEDPARVAAANAVMNKPVSSRELVATLERVLA